MLLSQRLTATASSSCPCSSHSSSGGELWSFRRRRRSICSSCCCTRSVGGVWRTRSNTTTSSCNKLPQYVLCRTRFRTKMEFFAPQLRDTKLPFHFVSEYYAMPMRASRDTVSPICFWGFNKPKVSEVVQAGDPVLHEPALEVRAEDIGTARIEKIINDMVATMRNAPGVGLAAPQIGEQFQIIVLEDTKELMSYASPEEIEAQQREPFDLLVIINPKLTRKIGSDTAIFFEGCLSVDGYRALVERDLEVEVSGLGRDGKPVHVKASGWKARILQHECDHLVGDLYVDKMVPRTFRTKANLRLPLAAGCPKLGPLTVSGKSVKVPTGEI